MASQKTVDAVVKAVDVVEETAETLERIPKVNLNGTTKKQQVFILLATATFAAVGGAVLGASVAAKRFKLKYEEIAEQEIEEARRYYSVLHKDGKLGDPVTALEELVQENGYAAPPSSVTTSAAHPALAQVEKFGAKPKPEEKNVFRDSLPAKDDWDYDEELTQRTETEPYIIHHDEFFQGDKDYVQQTLTFYSNDDVLIDARDDIIEDSDATVGDLNLQKFGHGSKDNRIVYVRNDRLEVDFEIIKNEGSYSKDVLGVLQHSHRPGSGKPRRMRRDDE